MQLFESISDSFLHIKGFAVVTAFTLAARVAPRLDIVLCTVTAFCVAYRYFARGHTAAVWHVGAIATYLVDQTDCSEATAILAAMHLPIADATCQAVGAYRKFWTLPTAAMLGVAIGKSGNANLQVKRSMFTYRRKSRVALSLANSGVVCRGNSGSRHFGPVAVFGK